MAEYIDREKALFAVMNAGCTAKTVEVIANIPAADVAPVVQCKDCKFYNNHAMRDVVFDEDACHWNADEQPDPDDFCSAGERRCE